MQILSLKRMRNQVLDSLYQTPRATILEEFCRRGAGIYVLGGAIRDVIASDFGHQAGWAPRDFDVGVTGVSSPEFDYVLSGWGRRNRHGGFVLEAPGRPRWDVWRLENSIGLRKTGAAFSLENVLRSFNLDCNAIALNVRTGLVADAGAVDAIRERRVGFVHNVIRHSHETFAAKALLAQLRFGYSTSSALDLLIKTHLERGSLLYESRKVFPGLSLIGSSSSAFPLARA
jgi:hypothetical protein